MFDIAVKYAGFLKHVPVLPHAFDGLLKMNKLFTNKKILDYIDEIENEVSGWEGVTICAHKFGGLQFDAFRKEIGHIHGNGLLDILFTRRIKEQLVSEGKAKEHHVFKNSGWISLPVTNETEKNTAVELLRLSYSRIVEGKNTNVMPEDHSPDHESRKAPWRIAFIALSWLFTSLTLTYYSALLVDFIGATNFGREFIICGGQIVFQFILLILFRKKISLIINYLAQMMGVSLIGSILLVPALAIHYFFPLINPLVFLAWFMLVVGIMLVEHLRRVKNIQAPKWLSATWVVYRIIVLVIILFL